MDSPKRFKDSGETKYTIADRFLVECPRCKKQCIVSTAGGGADLFLPRKVTCSNCGFSERWQSNTVYTGNEHDWYFLLPLWLQTACCGERLYAFNEKHLEFLERYIEAEHREQVPNVNKSIISRLPLWIKNPKNREKLLKAIATMRARK